jgi:hypothetical protein
MSSADTLHYFILFLIQRTRVNMRNQVSTSKVLRQKGKVKRSPPRVNDSCQNLVNFTSILVSTIASPILANKTYGQLPVVDRTPPSALAPLQHADIPCQQLSNIQIPVLLCSISRHQKTRQWMREKILNHHNLVVH